MRRCGVCLVALLSSVPVQMAWAETDLTLWRDGDSHVTPTLQIDSALFAESNAWFGEGEANAGASSSARS